jgi:hypothetical protein
MNGMMRLTIGSALGMEEGSFLGGIMTQRNAAEDIGPLIYDHSKKVLG